MTAPAATPARARSAPNTDEGSVLSTLNQDGSRRWLQPRPSHGSWHKRRMLLAYLLIAVFTVIPHIRIGGKHLVLLDLTTRRFTIFTHTFLPTDTLLLALLMVGTAITVFLFTALLGRVWCGWACPQTVYLEFVYRPIERFFEGTPGRPKKGWLQTSGVGKPVKFAAFFLVSCFLAHTFLAYFVPTETIREWMTRSPFDHPTPFLVMAVITGLMLFDFVFFREQTCLVACPYGRMQSTLLDRASLIVSYDPKRGEPRGKPGAKSVSLPVVGGDCVDCGLCVMTCPTGIDIRNGLQMECVHCTQCIDACDAVMTKLHRAPGLIRYASQAEIAGEARRFLRPRTVVYPAILAIIATAFLIVLLRQSAANVEVLRARGAVFTQVDAATVANQVQVKIINRLDAAAPFTISVQGPGGVSAQIATNPVTLGPSEMAAVPVMLTAPQADFVRGKLPVTITVTGPDGKPIVRPYTMAGPGSAHTTPGGTP